jgi:hypothetical protein
MTLYLLLKQVQKDAARAMVVFAAIGASITCLNAVFEFEPRLRSERSTHRRAMPVEPALGKEKCA